MAQNNRSRENIEGSDSANPNVDELAETAVNGADGEGSGFEENGASNRYHPKYNVPSNSDEFRTFINNEGGSLAAEMFGSPKDLYELFARSEWTDDEITDLTHWVTDHYKREYGIIAEEPIMRAFGSLKIGRHRQSRAEVERILTHQAKEKADNRGLMDKLIHPQRNVNGANGQ